MKKEQESNQLTAKKSDFSNWYSQILQLADIIDKRYLTKGAFVWKSYGYKIMMNIKNYWDKIFQDTGIKELYFPLLVPLEYAQINDAWFNGFKSEAYWVSILNDKNEKYILRPTGEPAMYPMFKLWIRSANDLPLRIYETVSSFRYETKHTRPLIRDREMTVWHEIHTAHATKEEAEKESNLHKKLWDKIWKKLALEPLRVKKPEWECFPGASGATEYYNVMPTGKVMENGSINNLGQAYSKKFNITFKDELGNEKFVWMICTGNGARYLAAVIAVHGDDKGLIIPPEIAPLKVTIIPIYATKDKEIVIKKAKKLHQKIRSISELDIRETSVGSKFYDWEVKGIPLRIEIGPKEIKTKSVVIVRRDNHEKIKVKETQLNKKIKELLIEIQNNLYLKSKNQLNSKIKNVKDLNELKEILKGNYIGKVSWCGSGKCWDEIKAIEEGIELFGTDLKEDKGNCIICNKNSNEKGYVANTY